MFNVTYGTEPEVQRRRQLVVQRALTARLDGMGLLDLVLATAMSPYQIEQLISDLVICGKVRYDHELQRFFLKEAPHVH